MASVIHGVLFCVLSALLTLYAFYYHVMDAQLTYLTPLYVILAGFSALLSVIFGYLSLRVLDKRTSPYHTYFTLFSNCLVDFLFAVVKERCRKTFEKDTKKWRETQDNILQQIFHLNAKTEHGLKYQFESLQSKDDFRRKHPLTNYEFYKQSIERVAKGETNILTSHKTIHMILTSGTTSSGCMFPASKKRFSEMLTLASMIDWEISPSQKTVKGQKSADIRLGAKVKFSDCGLSIGSMASFWQNKRGFVQTLMAGRETAPPTVLNILSEPESLYVQCVFALRDRTVSKVRTSFAHTLYNMFGIMETKWEQLTDDISKGRIDPKLDIDSDMRSELNSILYPNPQRAQELAREFRKGFKGIAKRVWPYLSYMSCITTGSMKVYSQKLCEYYAPGVPVISGMYLSSEGTLGVNLWPLDQQGYYALLPRTNFYEFIPLENCDQIQPDTLFSEELEIGKEYEIVITNEHGLYRYRLGDVVKFVRYHNDGPVIEFMYRRGQLLNLRGEKTPETAIYQALQDTVADLKDVRLVDYTCTDSLMLERRRTTSQLISSGITSYQDGAKATSDGEFQYYVIFLELERHGNVEGEVTGDVPIDQLNMQFDENLRKHATFYDMFRSQESIAPPRVYLVKPGSFKELKRYLVANSTATMMQFKMPRLLNKPGALDLLMTLTV